MYITGVYEVACLCPPYPLIPAPIRNNMSVSIDDLVSSFGSSHIGQEANDLAALQVSANIISHFCDLSNRALMFIYL